MKFIKNSEHPNIVILDKLFKAEKSIWISSADLKEAKCIVSGYEKLLISYLDEKLCDGLDIKIIHAGKESAATQKELEKLQLSKKSHIRICKRNHSKIIIIDEKILYIGSANLTPAALGSYTPESRNFEAGILTEDKTLIHEATKFFTSIWEGKNCATCSRKKVFCRNPICYYHQNITTFSPPIKKINRKSEKEIRKLRETNNNRSNILDILEQSKDKTILKDDLAALIIDHLELTLDIANLNETRNYYSSILQELIDEGIILEEGDSEKKAKLRLAK